MLMYNKTKPIITKTTTIEERLMKLSRVYKKIKIVKNSTDPVIWNQYIYIYIERERERDILFLESI